MMSRPNVFKTLRNVSTEPSGAWSGTGRREVWTPAPQLALRPIHAPGHSRPGITCRHLRSPRATKRSLVNAAFTKARARALYSTQRFLWLPQPPPPFARARPPRPYPIPAPVPIPFPVPSRPPAPSGLAAPAPRVQRTSTCHCPAGFSVSLSLSGERS